MENTLIIVLLSVLIVLVVGLIVLVVKLSKKKTDISDNKEVVDRINTLENSIKMDIQSSTNFTSNTMIKTVDSIGNSINNTVKENSSYQTEKIVGLHNAFIKSVEDNRVIQQNESEGIARILVEQNERNIAGERELRQVLDTKLTEINNDTKQKLTEINNDTNQKLTEVKQIVDEKLTSTINERFNNSFKIISESLNSITEGFKQMQDLSTGVTDLNKMLNNVKTRGVWGENTLDAILEDTFTPDQYQRSVNIKNNNLVDFAITLPGKDRNQILLPIDSKFPIEDYYRVVDASNNGNTEQLNNAVKELEKAVKKQARSIRDKYIDPPKTTNFALMFVPTESLYAEILRINDLAESVQREFRVVIVGPTTISALLNSLQLGFKTLAIQKSSEEIWKMFNQFRKDFASFTDNLEKIQKKLSEVNNTIEITTKRSSIIKDRLDKVENIQFIEE